MSKKSKGSESDSGSQIKHVLLACAASAGATAILMSSHTAAAPSTPPAYTLQGPHGVNEAVTEVFPSGYPNEVVMVVNAKGASATTSWQQTSPVVRGKSPTFMAAFNGSSGGNSGVVFKFKPASNPNMVCVSVVGTNKQVTINCSPS